MKRVSAFEPDQLDFFQKSIKPHAEEYGRVGKLNLWKLPDGYTLRVMLHAGPEFSDRDEKTLARNIAKDLARQLRDRDALSSFLISQKDSPYREGVDVTLTFKFASEVIEGRKERHESELALTLLSLRTGDYVEITSPKYKRKRVLEVYSIKKQGGSINVFVSSGKVRRGPEGGILEYDTRSETVRYQPTLGQNYVPVTELRKVSGKPRLSFTRVSRNKTAAGESLFETIQEFCNELARVSQKILRRETAVVAHRVNDASCHAEVTHKPSRQRFRVQYGIDASDVMNPMVVVSYVQGEEVLDKENLSGSMEPTDVAEQAVDRLLSLLPVSKEASLRQRRAKLAGTALRIGDAREKFALVDPSRAVAQLVSAVDSDGINFFAFDPALEDLMRGVLLEVMNVPGIDALWSEISRYVDGAADAIKRDAMHDSPNYREIRKSAEALKRGLPHLLRYDDNEDVLGQAGWMFFVMRDMLESMSRPRAAKLLDKAGKALTKQAELIAL